MKSHDCQTSNCGLHPNAKNGNEPLQLKIWGVISILFYSIGGRIARIFLVFLVVWYCFAFRKQAVFSVRESGLPAEIGECQSVRSKASQQVFAVALK